MNNVLDPADRRRLMDRLGRLTPESHRQWGTLSCGKMVCHLQDQVRVALGDLPVKDRSRWYLRGPVKWLAIYAPVRPPRGRIQTAPEMLHTDPEELDADRRRYEELVRRFVAADELHPHPMFGDLTRNQWGILIARHADHHLRQFGV
jgi:hypothetical protein